MSSLLGTLTKKFFIMRNNLLRISVGVVEDEYLQLKKLSKPGLSIGFLIREAIRDFLITDKNSQK